MVKTFDDWAMAARGRHRPDVDHWRETRERYIEPAAAYLEQQRHDYALRFARLLVDSQ